MTIAQAACTIAFCYGLASVRSICILFLLCRLGYVTLTAYELLKIGNRIQKNRSSLTRAALFWVLAPILVIDIGAIVDDRPSQPPNVTDSNTDSVRYR